MRNNQPPEKKIYSSDGILEVHSVFPTIQGEGPFSGQRSVFVRLAGCNLMCPDCDTEYTKNRLETTPSAILIEIQNQSFRMMGPKPLVVITGGEPFRQNLTPFVRLLLEEGYKVQIETNGTLPPSPQFPITHLHQQLFIVVSPKTGSVHKDIHSMAMCYKYVVDPRNNNIASDGLPKKALNHKNDGLLARPTTARPIYIQPVDTGDAEENIGIIEDVTSIAIEYGYILQMQLHKVIGVD